MCCWCSDASSLFSFNTAVWLSGSSDVVRTKLLNLSAAIECGTGKAFSVSAFLESVRHHWCESKVGTQKENTEHGLEVRKIYQQKLQRIVSNIGSRTSSTTTPVFGYYYASNIVLEESMMQVSFGLTTLSLIILTVFAVSLFVLQAFFFRFLYFYSSFLEAYEFITD